MVLSACAEFKARACAIVFAIKKSAFGTCDKKIKKSFFSLAAGYANT